MLFQLLLSLGFSKDAHLLLSNIFVKHKLIKMWNIVSVSGMINKGQICLANSTQNTEWIKKCIFWKVLATAHKFPKLSICRSMPTPFWTNKKIIQNTKTRVDTSIFSIQSMIRIDVLYLSLNRSVFFTSLN